jgi:hypothetical protein
MHKKDRAAVVAQLRQHIAKVAPVRHTSGRLAMEHPALERWVQGWPRGGISTVEGAMGVGRLGIVLPAMATRTQRGESVAVVDAVGWLHPPGLVGVVLERLLVVRPGTRRAGWAAEQIARCGAVPLVVVLDPPRFGRGGRRLQFAAEEGNSAVVCVLEAMDRSLPASVRLVVSAPDRVRVERGGLGSPGREIQLRPSAESPGQTGSLL